jgi:hypothetical protein
MRLSVIRRAVRLRDDSGTALVMSLGCSLVLAIMLTAVVEMGSASARQASRNNADQKAYAVAEQGIAGGAAVLFVSANAPPQTLPSQAACDDAASPWHTYKTTLPLRQTPAAGASDYVVWSGTLDCTAAAPRWLLTATGSVANPTGPGGAPVTRTVTAQVPLLSNAVTATATDSLPYGGAYFFAKNGDVWAKGNTSIEVPIFASGSLDFVNGPTGPATASTWIFPIARLINVGGYVKTNGIGLIGQPTTTLGTAIGDGTSGEGSTRIDATGTDENLFNSQATLKLVDPADPTAIEYFRYSSKSTGGFAGSGFKRGYGGKGAPTRRAWPVGTVITGSIEMHEGLGCSALACSPANKVWPSNTQPDANLLPFPTLLTPDMAALYSTAAPGPTATVSRPRTCTGTPPTFDNNSTLDHSAGTVASPINLAGVNYDCTQLAPDGTVGRIKWDGTTLTVRGTVFFDGDIKFGSALVYDTGLGGATIYTTGGINLESGHFCAVKPGSDCNLVGYDPVTNPTGWDSDNNRLGLVAATFPGDIGVSHDVESVKHVQALVFCDGTYRQKSGAVLQGMVTCNNIDLREGGSAPSPSVSKIPTGFPKPSSTSTTTTVQLLAPRDFAG